MHLRFFLFTSLLYLTSCSDSQTPFCSCIEAGNRLNVALKDVYTKDITSSEKSNIEKLKKEQDTLCADYKYMDGAQMLELQKECDNE
jgi:hypothetical protein